MKKIKIVFMTALCFILMMQPVISYADVISIGYVPLFRQPSDSLTCWSTCVAMAACYFNGDTTNRQTKIQLDAFQTIPRVVTINI